MKHIRIFVVGAIVCLLAAGLTTALLMTIYMLIELTAQAFQINKYLMVWVYGVALLLAYPVGSYISDSL